jgi:hypothetical protein
MVVGLAEGMTATDAGSGKQVAGPGCWARVYEQLPCPCRNICRFWASSVPECCQEQLADIK